MKIKVETIYGNVNLRSYYDCDSSSDFYNAYDDNDHYLGELWDLPYYDENDKESMEFLKVAIETAIECNDICTPFDTEKENDIIYLITVFECYNGYANIESYAYDSVVKCMEAKMVIVNAFTEKCDKDGLKYEVHDDDVICEIMTDDESKYIHITMKATTVM